MKKLFSVQHNNQLTDLSLLIARIGIGLLMLTHGIPKIDGFSNDPVQFIDILGLGTTISLGLAVFAEVFSSILIMLGLATRLATIPLITTMAVAVFHVHSNDPFTKQEGGLQYLLVYIILLLLGSGKYSIDNLLFKKNQ